MSIAILAVLLTAMTAYAHFRYREACYWHRAARDAEQRCCELEVENKRLIQHCHKLVFSREHPNVPWEDC